MVVDQSRCAQPPSDDRDGIGDWARERFKRLAVDNCGVVDGDAPRPTRGFFARRWRTLVVVLLILATLTLAGIPVVQALIRP